jgi:hypothetical protein
MTWELTARQIGQIAREAGAAALEEAAKDARTRGDIGKPDGVEAWDWLDRLAVNLRLEGAA